MRSQASGCAASLALLLLLMLATCMLPLAHCTALSDDLSIRRPSWVENCPGPRKSVHFSALQCAQPGTWHRGIRQLSPTPFGRSEGLGRCDHTARATPCFYQRSPSAAASVFFGGSSCAANPSPESIALLRQRPRSLQPVVATPII